VPTATSRCFGTIAVRKPADERFANFTWLPVVPTSTQPAASKRRRISRNVKRLGGTHLDLERPHFWRSGGYRGCEVQRQRIGQVLQSRGLVPSLASDVDFQTLSEVPPAFSPDACCEFLRSAHALDYPKTAIEREL
jgi:hypothetical protein